MRQRNAAVLAAALALAPGICAAAIRSPLYPGKWWHSPLPYITGDALGDLNGDGVEDMIVTGAAGTVAFFGDGDGTFQAPVKLSKVLAWHPILGDFNNDGHVDVVSVGNQPVLIAGKGDGNFAPPVDIVGSSLSFTDVAAADFDNDGNEDLLLLSKGGFRLYRGTGNGTFRPSTSESWQSGAGYGVATGDFNGDGNTDIAVTDTDGTATVYPGNGDMTLGPPATYPVGIWPDAIYAGDFNHDGHPDLVTENQNTYDISLLINNGDGTFQPQQAYRVGNSPQGGTFSDLNGDGYPDFLETAFDAGGLQLFMGNPQGSLGTPVLRYLGGESSLPRIGDLDGDGKPDLVAATEMGWFARYLGKGGASFHSDEHERTDLSKAGGMAHADFNNDGIPDLAACGSGSALNENLYVALGNGDGSFGPARLVRTLEPVAAAAVAARDVDGDGNADLVTIENQDASPRQARLVVYPGNGDGTFQAPRAYPAGTEDGQLLMKDLNADGFPDAVVHDFGAKVYAAIKVLLNNGDGTFAAPVAYGSANPQHLAEADLNGDGIPDLVVAGDDGSVYANVMLGNGDGSFGAAGANLLPEASAEVNGIAAGDLNGDGRTDLVFSGDTMRILLGNGDGTFGQPAAYPLTGTYVPGGVWIADADGDGKPDILVKDRNRVYVLAGDGDGGIARQETYSAGQNGGLLVFDANGDGLPDLVSMAHDPDAESIKHDLYIALHLPPRLAITTRSFSATGARPLHDTLDAADPGNRPVTYSVLARPPRGTLSLQGDGAFTYTADPGVAGRDLFRVAATDGQTSTSSTIQVNVERPAPPGISGLPGTLSVKAKNPDRSLAFSLQGVNPLSLSVVSSNTGILPDSGISWNADCAQTHQCTLQLKPRDSRTGKTEITLTVADAYGQSGSAHLSLEVTGQPPSGGGASSPAGLGALLALLIAARIGRRRPASAGA